MGKWRDKPILFEVYDRRRARPEPSPRPATSTGGAADPLNATPAPTPPTHPNPGGRSSTSNTTGALAIRRILNSRALRHPALAAAAAGAVVLILAGYFIVWQLTHGTRPNPDGNDPIASALLEAPDPSVLEVPESQRRSAGRIAAAPSGDERPAAPRSPDSSGSAPAPPAAPRPEPRKKGWTYLVIQHFPRAREDDARAAADFLRKNDVPCDVEVLSREVRLVSSEGFLVDQKDAAASHQARLRLDDLKKRVLAAGKQYARTGNYAFEMCYPQKF